MGKSLFEFVNEVEDEVTFMAYSITSFLEATAKWGQESLDGLLHYKKPDNPWKRCAQIMYMGKIYE
ncbi:DUF7660 family protein [Paenibacillus sp. Z3-2]